MAAELRWILLGFSLVLLAGIWWWGARRGGQAVGNAELRESKMARAEVDAPAAAPVIEERDWGVPPFEPLSIRTDDYDRVPVLDAPMLIQAHPLEHHNPVERAVEVEIEVELERTVEVGTLEAMDTQPVAVKKAPAPTQAPAMPAPAPNASEQQKIVTIRVSAAGEARWSGVALLTALEAHGLAFGRYQVFHRRHSDGRSLFCAASLVEPGTFDISRMALDEFKGVTLFAVLPGPVEPLLTIDELFTAARGLAEDLAGVVQDSKGAALSPQRAAAMRDDVARFQASLPLG